MGSLFTIRINQTTYTVDVGDVSRSPVSVDVDGQAFEVEFEEHDGRQVQPVASVREGVERRPRQAPSQKPAAQAGGNAVLAPMSGEVLKVNVKPGDSVSAQDVVCVLEAMKMEQMIKAGRDGVVEAVQVQQGQNVSNGAVLVTFQG